MRTRTLTKAALVLLFSAAMVACSAGSGVRPAAGGGGEEDPFPPSTQVGGTPPYPGIEVTKITEPGPGTPAAFRISNRSGKDLKYLTGTILFFFEPKVPGIAKTASKAYLQGFDIFKDETIELKAAYTGTQPLERMQLRVELGATVPGMTFLDGGLECTDVVNELSSMNAEERKVVFTIVNNSGKALESVKYKVVLLDRSTGNEIPKAGTRWKSVMEGAIPAGKTLEVTPTLKKDISGFPIAVLLIKQAG